MSGWAVCSPLHSLLQASAMKCRLTSDAVPKRCECAMLAPHVVELSSEETAKDIDMIVDAFSAVLTNPV